MLTKCWMKVKTIEKLIHNKFVILRLDLQPNHYENQNLFVFDRKYTKFLLKMLKKRKKCHLLMKDFFANSIDKLPYECQSSFLKAP